MSPLPTPPVLLPPLNEHQVKTLALLLRRAVANSQLVLHEQALDAAGRETEDGASLVAEDWGVATDTITYVDGAPARFGIHLYVAGADLAALSGEE